MRLLLTDRVFFSYVEVIYSTIMMKFVIFKIKFNNEKHYIVNT